MACSSVEGTQFRIPNLIKGVQYQFRVCAENRYGVSEPLVSQMVIAKHQFRPPGPPGKPIVYNVTNDGMTIQWEKPIYDGGTPIQGYHVEKKEKNSIMWQKVNTHTVTGLTTNERYEFRVIARNAIGVISPPSNSSGLIVVRSENATPDAPGTPDATEVTGESITLSWTPPTSDGGNPVKSYILEKREKKTLRFYKVLTKKPIIECAHKVTNLTEDVEYEFRVMAVNDAGVGAPSNISIPIKAAEPKDIPCAPSVVCVSDSTNTSISLEWTKPVDDGGMEILGYIIEMIKGEETEWKRVNEELVAETNYKVTGLQTGAEYKFRVAAVNHIGRGEDQETPEHAQAIDRLTPPQVDIDATFKQTHILKAGGSVCLGIHFRGQPIPTCTWLKEEGEIGAMSEITTTDKYSSLSIENCSRNDTGKYTVNLENASGSKSLTFVVKVMDTPGPPQAVAFKEVSRGSVTLVWKPPLNDGGSRIYHYIVERREASRRTWQQCGAKCTQHLLMVQDLLEGVPYFFRVSAENQHGVGEAFELPDPVTATAEPASPKKLEILDTTDSSVSLGWLKPEHDGGSRIQCYTIEARPKGTDKWVVVGNTKNLIKPKETVAPVLVKEPHIEPAADLSDIANQLITCNSGKTFIIDVPISGRPTPKVTWKLEEMRLKSSDRVTIKVTKDRTSISVREAMRGDGGKYYLTLENAAGTRTFNVLSSDALLLLFLLSEPPKAQLDSKLLSETVMVRAGSDLVLDAAVGGRPDPKAFWSKGSRELEICEKYHLQYTPTKAMAIIKFCDRDDTGKYILTVRNVSGTKTAEVNVKVLGT
uniref:Titin n=1 Tax=Oryzias latipes TaxID=8090 RepID=A0A3B3H9U0_ORYLA